MRPSRQAWPRLVCHACSLGGARLTCRRRCEQEAAAAGDPATRVRAFGAPGGGRPHQTAQPVPGVIAPGLAAPAGARRARATVAGAPRGREAVVGDPAAWTRVLAALEAVRVAARPRGARTVVVVVQPPGEPPAELPEERLGPICRQGALERRRALHNLLTLSLSPGRPPPSVPRGCARLGAGAPGRKPPFPESNVWPAGSACAPGHGVPWSWRVRPVRRQRAQSARAAAGGWRA